MASKEKCLSNISFEPLAGPDELMITRDMMRAKDMEDAIDIHSQQEIHPHI